MLDFNSRFDTAISRFTTEFIVDQENSQVIQDMKNYFQNDLEFEKNGLSLQKGILLMGTFGSGKTILFKVFQKTTGGKFKINMCPDVAMEYSSNGHAALMRFADKEDRCFDDLGMESRQKFYGQEENTMALVIARRYEIFRSFGTVTHFTTNLNGNQIREHYGERVYSRLQEMCNFIILGGNENSTDRRLNAKVPVRRFEGKEKIVTEIDKDLIFEEWLDSVSDQYKKFCETGEYKVYDHAGKFFTYLRHIGLINFTDKIREEILQQAKVKYSLDQQEKRTPGFLTDATKIDTVMANIKIDEMGSRMIDLIAKEIALRRFLADCKEMGENLKELIFQTVEEKF